VGVAINLHARFGRPSMWQHKGAGIENSWGRSYQATAKTCIYMSRGDARLALTGEAYFRGGNLSRES
jgi:hypothetical protein